jgi:ornithine cyclodeaminase/alanine dehydrogenase-like protein (mu-crystallin family)
MDPAPLRYLTADDVRAAMPPLDERLDLAEQTLIALAAPGGAELPPKVALHPRPADSFAHAMPAYLRATDAAADLLGMKWIAGFPGNRATGMPALHGIVLLNDATTGVPTAILDAGPITAHRTAAVTGVVIRHFAPQLEGRAPRAALIGAGVQGHSHLPVFAHLLSGVELTIFDRHADRADELVTEARTTSGIAAARSASDPRTAVDGADVVVTAASFGPVRQVMRDDWLVPHALLVAVDYATYCSAEVARDADLFLVDQREQFIANREAGLFEGYPDPDATIGQAILEDVERPIGRVVVTHLGVGLADVVFGSAMVRRAESAGRGMVLPR